jgi:PKD repeat protein
VASFKWFPSLPQTGEPVSLVSSSTDASSPITGTAWAFGADGLFQPGGEVLTTSFATPGAHVVRLLVSDANGFSSIASESISVVSPRVLLMAPFPVVRIAGSQTSAGVRLRLLRIQQTPVGASVLVRCRGRGCPTRSQRRLALAGPRGAVPVDFRRFQRVLGVGVTLEILIWKPGSIGKYTRFTVRRHKLPVRVDTCLDPTGVSPQPCPPS